MSNQPEDARRSLQMNVSNALIMEREVSSGIFDDTREDRVRLIRSLLDALLVTTNSSDSASTFQELVITTTVRYPDLVVNQLAGDVLPTASDGKQIPYGIRIHKSKAFGRKKAAGKVMYVKNHKKCWVVATYYCCVHYLTMKNIFLLETEIVERAGNRQD